MAQKTFEHPTCKVHLHAFDKLFSWDDKIISKLRENLKEHGYNTSFLNSKKELAPGDFHLLLKRTLSGKVFKACLIELNIKRAKTKYALDSDPVFYKQEKSRSFPRQTFKGRERCYMALDDTFFALDICKKRQK
jgi:hypothetical protein